LSFREGLEVTKDNTLSLHGVDLNSLCEKYGTPLFVFDEETLRKNFREFSNAFKKHYPKTIICFSVKTNYNLAICKLMREEGAYAEVASGLDLAAVKKAGFPPNRIIFDGLYKSESALREAIDYNVMLINAETFSELEQINKIAGEAGKKQSIGIRVSSFSRKLLSPETLYCYPLSRFGFSFEDAYKAVKKAQELENLEVKALMVHPYSWFRQLLLFARRVKSELNIELEFINLGGGFVKGSTKIGLPDLMKDAIRQRLGLKSKLDVANKSTTTKSIKEIADSTAPEVKQMLGNDEPFLIFEPGRYFIHDAGILLLGVGVVKEAAGSKWVIADGGTNLVSDWLERREIRIINRANESQTELVNMTGPLLFARDFVTLKQWLPRIQEGDKLAIFNVGAYTLSASSQFLHPRPCAVLVGKGGKAAVIRRKETYEDVLRMDEI
jgi:diaminopimelate decarboxylase